MKVRLKKIHGILKSKLGVTLMELIMALSILTIFMATASALLIPIMNTYTSANELSNVTVIANNISETIANDISYAQSVSVNGDTISIIKFGGEKVEWKSDPAKGIILKNDAEFFHEKYYKKNKVKLESIVYDSAKSTCCFSVSVSGKVDFTKTNSIKLLKK